MHGGPTVTDRYSRKDVDRAATRLSQLLGIPLAINAWSPGDRYGTRYRIHEEGDKPGTLGRQLHAECGAGRTTEDLWQRIYGIEDYKRYTETPTPAYATEQLHNLEAGI